MNRALLLAALALALALPSGAVAKERPLALYRDARFEILQTADSAEVSPEELCAELKKANPDLGRPRCAVAGSLRRNVPFNDYALWVAANLRPGVRAEDLEARRPEVRKTLEERRDDYLFLFKSDGKESWLVLFHDGERIPARLLRVRGESAFGEVAPLFQGPTSPIPTEQEREAARREPEAFYRDQLPLDFRLTVGSGYIQGFGGHESAQVEHYTQNRDSASAWDWITDSSPLVFAEYGVEYARFLGIAAVLQWSRYDMKFNPETNPAIRDWTVDRWEFGARARIGYGFVPRPKVEIHPYLLLGFLYTVYDAEISWKKGVKKPFDSPFSLVAVSGGSLALGADLLLKDRYGAKLECGLSRRARKSRTDPEVGPLPDRPAEATLELYALFGLSLNWRRWL
ncbi:MAG: hypothetical protein J6T45_04655 [Fibrobacterales bacterium]|nr:hypothetical protein [Fibrobacterales bacterium]